MRFPFIFLLALLPGLCAAQYELDNHWPLEPKAAVQPTANDILAGALTDSVDRLTAKVESLENRIKELETHLPQPTPALSPDYGESIVLPDIELDLKPKAEPKTNPQPKAKQATAASWKGATLHIWTRPSEVCDWCKKVKDDGVETEWAKVGMEVKVHDNAQGFVPRFSVCFADSEMCFEHSGYFPGATTKERRALFDGWILACDREAKAAKDLKQRTLRLRSFVRERISSDQLHWKFQGPIDDHLHDPQHEADLKLYGFNLDDLYGLTDAELIKLHSFFHNQSALREKRRIRCGSLGACEHYAGL